MITYYTPYLRSQANYYNRIVLKELQLSRELGCTVEEFKVIQKRLREYAKSSVYSYEDILDWVYERARDSGAHHSPLLNDLYDRLVGKLNERKINS